LSSLAFSPNGERFSAAFASPIEEQNSVEIWNVASWAISQTLKTGTVLNFAYSPDGGLLATTPDRYAIRVWDFAENDWIFKLHTSFTGAVNALVFSPDGGTLATGHYDGTIRLWDSRTGSLVLVIETGSVVESLAFSPDGKLLASGGSFEDSQVRLWTAGSGVLLSELEGHTKGVNNLLFAPNGQYLVSASYDGTLRLWGIRP
jgi:WD40 repeat protein